MTFGEFDLISIYHVPLCNNKFIKNVSLLQNSVSFAQAPAFSRLKAAKHAFFKGCCCKNWSFATASRDKIFCAEEGIEKKFTLEEIAKLQFLQFRL